MNFNFIKSYAKIEYIFSRETSCSEFFNREFFYGYFISSLIYVITIEKCVYFDSLINSHFDFMDGLIESNFSKYDKHNMCFSI